MKKILTVLAVLLVLFLGAAVVVPLIVDINHFKGSIEKVAQEKSGYGMQLGRISWKLLPSLSLRLEDLHVQEGIGIQSPDLFSARNVEVALRWGPLLRKNLEIKEITLVGPNILITRAKDGTISLTPQGSAPPRSSGRKSPRHVRAKEDRGELSVQSSGVEPAKSKNSPFNVQQFQLASFKIEDGSVEFRQQREDGSTLKLKWADVQCNASHIGLGQKVRFKAKAKMGGPKGAPVKISGWVGPLAGSDWTSIAWNDLPLDARLSATGLDAKAMGSFIDMPDLDGTMDWDVTATRENGRMSFQMDFRGADMQFRMSGKSKKVTPSSIRADAAGWLEEGKLFLDKANISIASTKASLRKTSYSFLTHDFEGTVNATLRLEDILPWMGDLPGGTAQGEAVVDLTVKGNTERLRDVQMEGTMDMDSFRLRWPGILKRPVEGKGSIQIQKDLIRVRSLTLKVGKSDLRLDGKAQVQGDEPGRLSLESDFLDLEDLLECFERPAPRSAPIAPAGSGLVRSGGKRKPGGVLKAQPVVPANAGVLPAIPSGSGGSAPAIAPEQEKGLGKWSFQGQCKIGELVYQRNRLRNLQGDLSLQDGVFTLSRFAGHGYGGTFSTAFQCDLQDPHFAFRWGMRLTAIEINDVLAANSDFAGRVFGAMTSNVELAGRFPGDLDGLLASLEGSGQSEVQNMTISSFDLMERLSLITGLLGINRDKLNETKFEFLRTALQIRAGRVWTPDMQAKGDNFDLAGRGSFGFDRTLDYNVQVKLSPDLTTQLGRGQLVQALLGPDGTMTIPFAIRGRIDGPPQFTPMWEDLLTRGLGNYLEQRVFRRKSQEQTEPSTGYPSSQTQQPQQGQTTAMEDLLLQLLKK